MDTDDQNTKQAERDALFREALLAGASVEEAAKRAGVSARTVRRWLALHRHELLALALERSGAIRFLGGRPYGVPRLR